MKKNPTLVEMVGVIQDWWKEMENGKQTYELPLKRVLEFFFKKNVIQDREKGKSLLRIKFNVKPVVNYDMFFRVFIKGIFLKALVNVYQVISKSSNTTLNLQNQLHIFTRQLKIVGIDTSSSENAVGRNNIRTILKYKQEKYGTDFLKGDEELERKFKKLSQA
jgi:hypothetical protein